MQERTQRIQVYAAWVLLIVLVLAYTVFMSHQAVLRYDTFKATAFDLGNMDQAIWNTLHGRPFQFTNQGADWYGPPTRLAFHFEPILLLLSLLYVFAADPRILLVFQTLALAAGAIPVFLLTRHQVSRWPLLAPTMVIAYLFSPALLGLNIFDFHPVSLATPLFLYAILALTYRRYVLFLLACVLASACKEDVPLAVAMLGVLVYWKYKLPRLGAVLTLGGLIWSLLAFMVIIPHFFPGGLQHNNYWYRYEALGSSPGAALVNILLHPGVLFTTLITLDRIYYLAGLFRSSAFLPLLAPEWLLPALPSLAVNLMSTDGLLYSGVYHYNAAIIPFVMLAAIYGARRLLARWEVWRGEAPENGMAQERLFARLSFPREKKVGARPGLVAAGVAPLMTAFEATTQLVATQMETLRCSLDHLFAEHPSLTRPVAFVQPGLSALGVTRQLQSQRMNARLTELARVTSVARLQWIVCGSMLCMTLLNLLILTPLLNGFWVWQEPGSREQHIQHLLAQIPPDASVAAGANLNPHLTDRRDVTVFPEITFISPEKGGSTLVQYIIVDLYGVFTEDQLNTTNELNQLVTSKQFRILARAEGVILLERTGT